MTNKVVKIYKSVAFANHNKRLKSWIGQLIIGMTSRIENVKKHTHVY